MNMFKITFLKNAAKRDFTIYNFFKNNVKKYFFLNLFLFIFEATKISKKIFVNCFTIKKL